MPRRRSSLLSPGYYLRRGALRKGLFGGSTGWMVVGAFVWGPRIVKRLLGRNEVVVATEVLEPGQGVVLQTIPQQTRAQRRALRAAK
jgi:hypothetical protein